ncbi:MAG: hypothetical protein QOH57_2200 [Mycobacterium sp.]|nr:hypothetical protein [Mycobacterium sp.]
MERSSVRYAAVACVIAGGLLMSGTGGVALAKPESPSTPGKDAPSVPGKDAPSKPDKNGPDEPSEPDTSPPGHGGDHGLGYKTPTAGPIAVPKFNIPLRLGPLTLPAIELPQFRPFNLPPVGGPQSVSTTPAGTKSLPGLRIPTLSFEQLGLGTGEVPHAAVPAPGNGGIATPATSPTISLLPLVPPDHAGPPLIIKNPLPDTLPIDLDLPIVPQLLPPPIVPVLALMSQQIPLVDLVMSPLNNIVLPPLLSDIIVPALLSDVIVPTVSIDSFIPGTGVPLNSPMSSQVAAALTPMVAPPAELAPMGMDMPQAPLTSPGPLPSAPMVDPPRLPALPAPPPQDRVAQLSEPVAFRAGYSDYLRNAGMAQITSIALPGVVGILLVTVGGGFIGYRQARAGHIIRAQGNARFLR